MPASSSFNPPYFVEKLIELFGGQVPAVQVDLFTIVQYVEWTAIALSTIMFVIYVSLQLGIERVEESQKHKRVEEEIEVAGGLEPTNPRWENILELVASPHEGDWRRAVLEADNMMRDMLLDKGFIGGEVGELLHSASSGQFSTLDLAWEAHRLRNRIAHEGESVHLEHRDVSATIDMYRRVFEEFDYI